MEVAWPELRGFPSASLPKHVHGLSPGSGAWDALRGSAVCLLFIPPATGASAARVLLTRRSITVRSHRGQIGFAGGRAEQSDESPGTTALRELHEELGIPPERVAVAGTLASVKALDSHPVVPVVCCAAIELRELKPAPDEVAYAFAEPWTSFARGMSRPFRFNMFGTWRTSQSFSTADGLENIWGLTALILHAADLASEP
jgi:8-oxo-dGTP pyrophosphatase MutT (NUDIX family)